MLTCPNCGSQVENGVSFCENCGSALTHEAVPAEKKKKSSKKVLLFAVLALVVMAAAAVFALKLPKKGGSGSPAYALYVRDWELRFDALDQDGPLQLTSRLFSDTDADNERLLYATESLNSFCLLSDDGKLLFFPDKIDHDTQGGFPLYYRNVDKPDQDAVRIDSMVSRYHVNTAATLVTYLKENVLYQYDLKKDEKEKIDSDISSFTVSDAGDKIIYRNAEGSIYLKYAGKDKEKIAGDASICHLSEDLSTVFYLKDGALYQKAEGSDSVKLASDVSDVLHVYDSGQVYYTTKTATSEFSLMDFVEDDKKEEDLALEDLPYPQEPDYYPYWDDYETVEEYDAAYEAYEAAYEEYWTLVNEYEDKYSDKRQRDELREELAQETMSQTTYSLCYYDGDQTTVLTEDFASTDNAIADDAPVMVYTGYTSEMVGKLKLSELYGTYDVRDRVDSARKASSDWYVAVGGVSSPIEQTSASGFRISADGSTIYFIDNVPENKSHGELYQITVSNGAAQAPVLYDSDVYRGFSRLTKAGLLYFKDYRNGKGELYRDKTKLDFDVWSASGILSSEDGNILVYYTDWNSDKGYGTLKTYTGDESTRIADDVNVVRLLSDGTVLYLLDYSRNYFRGTLYVYRNAQTEKLADDVARILVPDGGRYGLYRYYPFA